MGYYIKDVANNPEHFGLESIGSIELRNAAYEFDILAVLYSPERKNFYTVEDSGCSCPVPFEGHTTFESLGRALTAHEAVAYVQRRVAEASESSYGYPDDPSNLVAAIMRK